MYYDSFTKDESFEIVKEKTIHFAMECAEHTIRNHHIEYIRDDGALINIMYYRCNEEMTYLMKRYLHYFWEVVKEIRNIYDEQYYKTISFEIDKLMDDVRNIVKDIIIKDIEMNVKKDYNQFYKELDKLVPNSIRLDLEFLFRSMNYVPTSVLHFIVKDLYENFYLKNINDSIDTNKGLTENKTDNGASKKEEETELCKGCPTPCACVLNNRCLYKK
jgi:hypothetical protein